MSLDDLATRAPGRMWQECGIHYALRVLPPARADVLRAALANPNVGPGEIAEALAQEDLAEPPGAFAVGRHKANPRRCKCVDDS